MAKTKTTYICTLTTADQNRMRQQLENIGLSDEDIEIAMDGRICDLEDTIEL